MQGGGVEASARDAPSGSGQYRLVPPRRGILQHELRLHRLLLVRTKKGALPKKQQRGNYDRPPARNERSRALPRSRRCLPSCITPSLCVLNLLQLYVRLGSPVQNLSGLHLPQHDHLRLAGAEFHHHLIQSASQWSNQWSNQRPMSASALWIQAECARVRI